MSENVRAVRRCCRTLPRAPYIIQCACSTINMIRTNRYGRTTTAHPTPPSPCAKGFASRSATAMACKDQCGTATEHSGGEPRPPLPCAFLVHYPSSRIQHPYHDKQWQYGESAHSRQGAYYSTVTEKLQTHRSCRPGKETAWCRKTPPGCQHQVNQAMPTSSLVLLSCMEQLAALAIEASFAVGRRREAGMKDLEALPRAASTVSTTPTRLHTDAVDQPPNQVSSRRAEHAPLA